MSSPKYYFPVPVKFLFSRVKFPTSNLRLPLIILSLIHLLLVPVKSNPFALVFFPIHFLSSCTNFSATLVLCITLSLFILSLTHHFQYQPSCISCCLSVLFFFYLVLPLCLLSACISVPFMAVVFLIGLFAWRVILLPSAVALKLAVKRYRIHFSPSFVPALPPSFFPHDDASDDLILHAALCLYRYFPMWRPSRSMQKMYLCVSHLSEHLRFSPPSPFPIFITAVLFVTLFEERVSVYRYFLA